MVSAVVAVAVYAAALLALVGFLLMVKDALLLVPPSVHVYRSCLRQMRCDMDSKRLSKARNSRAVNRGSIFHTSSQTFLA